MTRARNVANVLSGATINGRNVSADGAKLDNIEANADVTDTDNVTSAGAVMDSDFSANGLMSRTGAGTYTNVTDNSTNWNTAYGWGDHSSQGYATTTYVDGEVAGLVDAAPAALDTLNELAAALGDDANFSTTVTNSLATKAPLASPALTGTPTAPTASANTNTTQLATTAYVQGELANEANWNTAYGWGDHSTQNYAVTTGDTMTGDLSFGDNTKATFGAGSDLQIYHSGVGSFISEVGVGSLNLQGTNLNLQNGAGTATYLTCADGGAVSLRYNGSAKLATTNTGVTVTGTVTADGVSLGDNEKAQFGASNDLQIYHDGSNSYVKDAGTGNLYLQGDNEIRLTATSGETYIYCANNGTTELRYDNSAKLATTSTGVSVTGSVNVTDASTTRTNLGLGSLATLSSVNASTITDNSVGAAELNVSGNGTSGQFLASDGDGTFSWADAGGGAPTTYTQGASWGLSSSQPPINYDVTDTGNATFPISGTTADVTYSANVSVGHNPAENTSATVQISFDNGSTYTTLANGNGKGYNMSGNTKISQSAGDKTVKLRMYGYSGQLDNNNRYRNLSMNVSILDVNIING